MIASKRQPLLKDLDRLFALNNANSNECNRVLLVDCLEYIVSLSEWSWLSRDDLIQTITASAQFYLDGLFVRMHNVNHETIPLEAQNYVAKDNTVLYFPESQFTTKSAGNDGLIEIYPEILWQKQLKIRSERAFSNFTVVYESLETALAVSWAISGDLRSSQVQAVEVPPKTPLQRRAPWLDGVFMLSGTACNELGIKSAIIKESTYRKIQLNTWIRESLYQGDIQAQGLATKKLYKILPRSNVETLMLEHLKSPDPDVRLNALSVIGSPFCRVGFSPGSTLPSKPKRLEHVAMHKDTLTAILNLVYTEDVQEVIDGLVCTLGAQGFHGSLFAQAQDVKKALLTLIPKIESKQSTRDALKIIREIQNIHE